MHKRWWWAAAAVPCALLLLPASSLYYKSPAGEGCARCHEIRPEWNLWRESTHRGVPCMACHADSMAANSRRVIEHVSGDVPEQIRIKGLDAYAMLARCQSCHRQEFADWQAGPHGVTFTKLFLDPKQNRQRLLMDDCLRCHGMNYEGGIRDLITPIDRQGPWRMTDARWTNLPAIPCLACHQMHRRGEPRAKQLERTAGSSARESIYAPSLALFDRREMAPVADANLAIPRILDGGRPVRMSPDVRQGLCYQCHAPLSTRQAESGDDRTGLGIHEGISCLACHQKHGQQTRASCANCHPRLSNCGLDVEKMDTTFLSAKSAHNIHSAKCVDCHTRGVPKKRPPAT
ncbi:MAG TPA: cytochrome c3 family protein [Bryobacteraceae bacterium]|nr:cytochrome c3 family protein [Bryobacteraceae bacterium]